MENIALPAQTFDVASIPAKTGVHADTKNKAAVAKASREFESLFLNEMMQHMFAGISTNGMFGGGNGEDIYRSLMIKEYANGLAERGGIGLAAPLQKEILRLQESAR